MFKTTETNFIQHLLKILIIFFLFPSFSLSQTYTVGSYVDDFTGDICHNGDGTWSYDEHGRDKVTWINLFTSW